MVVRLRLQRFGRKGFPFYRIVSANAESPRDGGFLERLGTYNPFPDNAGNKHVSLNINRINHWLKVGAQPTDTVSKLLAMANVIPQPPQVNYGPTPSRKEIAEAAKKK